METNTILLIINSLLIGITGFFIKIWVNRIEKNIDSLVEKCQKLDSRLSYLEGKCEDEHGRNL